MFNFIGALNARAYIIVAAFTSALLFAISEFDRSEAFAGFLRGISADATRAGLSSAVTDIVMEPLILAVTDPVAAIAAGILWPLLLLWFLLVMLVLIFAFISPLVQEAGCAVGNC